MMSWLLRLTFVALIAVPVPTFADESTVSMDSTVYDDVIVLKNGATIRGSITEIEAGEKVVIEREDGYVMEVPHKRIAVITNEDGLERDKQEYFSDHAKETVPQGWQATSLLGAIVGDPTTSYAFSIVAGDDVSQRFWLGFAMLGQLASDGRIAGMGFELRYQLADAHSRWLPHLYVYPGWVLAQVKSRNKFEEGTGGPRMELGVGLNWNFGSRTGMVGRLGYSIVWADSRLSDPKLDDSRDSHGAAVVMLGLHFRP